MAQHVIMAEVPPSDPPTGIGQHYIDTANRVAYISVGIATTDDWLRMTVPANLDSKMDKSVAVQFRQSPSDEFQLWNADQSKWHTLKVTGGVGVEVIDIQPGESP